MEIVSTAPLLLAILAVLTTPASADVKFGVGDGLAIALFVIILIVAVCAVLGWVSRKTNS